MTAIVLADLNWGIAKDGKQILTIKKDLMRFKQMTKEKTVIFGRKTLEQLPGGKPLPGRINVCISQTLKNQNISNLIVLDDISSVNYRVSKDVFCIGGGQIYRHFYPQFDTIEVTRVLEDLDADLYFPPVDTDSSFERTNWSAKQYDAQSGAYYRFETYTRRRR